MKGKVEGTAAREYARQVGERIQKHRKDRGYSLAALAGRIGVSKSLVYQIERSQSAISLVLLHRLAAVLEVPIEELVVDVSFVTKAQRQEVEELLRKRHLEARIEGREVVLDLVALLDLLREGAGSPASQALPARGP